MITPLYIDFVLHGIGFRDTAQQQEFVDHVRGMLDIMRSLGMVPNEPGNNIFAGDNLITIAKQAGFLGDARFVTAVRDAEPDQLALSAVWRTHILCWAAAHAVHLPGDFVECGTYKGYSAQVIADYVGLKNQDRRLWLYDLFDPQGGEGVGERLSGHSPELYERVKSRFGDYPNVRVIRGKVPESFEQGVPDQVAFLHVDLNNAAAEIGALDKFFNCLSPGGVIIFDDYGWTYYGQQKRAEDAYMEARGYKIAELPTGQGLLIKR